MITYSAANLLNKGLCTENLNKIGFKKHLKSIVESFRTTADLSLVIPKSVYLRTIQICNYIEEASETKFRIENFIMLLYLEFINSSITDLDIFTIYKMIDRPNITNTVRITNGHDVCECNLKEYSKKEISITMLKKDVLKGELLLAEIYELYGRVFCLEKVISTLWINFINNYLKGDNKAILELIKSSLQNCNLGTT